MRGIDKDRPSPEWIAQLRRRFPIEREIDRVLTRKMERRSGPGYTPVPLNALVAGVPVPGLNGSDVDQASARTQGTAPRT